MALFPAASLKRVPPIPLVILESPEKIWLQYITFIYSKCSLFTKQKFTYHKKLSSFFTCHEKGIGYHHLSLTIIMLSPYSKTPQTGYPHPIAFL